MDSGIIRYIRTSKIFSTSRACVSKYIYIYIYIYIYMYNYNIHYTLYNVYNHTVYAIRNTLYVVYSIQCIEYVMYILQVWI